MQMQCTHIYTLTHTYQQQPKQPHNKQTVNSQLSSHLAVTPVRVYTVHLVRQGFVAQHTV